MKTILIFLILMLPPACMVYLTIEVIKSLTSKANG